MKLLKARNLRNASLVLCAALTSVDAVATKAVDVRVTVTAEASGPRIEPELPTARACC